MVQKAKNLILPKHIAFIIDGNGRWAKKRGMPRSFGHQVGAENVKKQIENAIDFGIKNISFYCFSTENWKRPKEEVDFLMDKFDEMLDESLNSTNDKDVRFIISGDLSDSRLPEQIKFKSNELMEKTKSKKGIIVNLCINYGGRKEIINAVNSLVKQNKVVTEDEFDEYLYTKDLLPLDLVVRTSGEQRLSNFMPWQSSYAELCFYKKYWPSFNKNDFKKILKIYSRRNRRFGAI